MGARACYCTAEPGKHCDAPDLCSRCQPCEGKIDALATQLAAAEDHRDRLFDALNHAVDYIKEMPYYEGKLFCLWEAEAALKNIRLVAPT